MKKITRDGLCLCELQARTFEDSVENTGVSSAVFIRRFMKSEIAKRLDDGSVLRTNLQSGDILERIDEEYGVSHYGLVKFTKDEMYWIGYIYRYLASTYEWSSAQVYKMIKPRELRGLFLPYHTMDAAQAIERIMEAKGLPIDEAGELERQYQIFKKVRQGA